MIKYGDVAVIRTRSLSIIQRNLFKANIPPSTWVFNQDSTAVSVLLCMCIICFRRMHFLFDAKEKGESKKNNQLADAGCIVFPVCQSDLLRNMRERLFYIF